MRTRLKLGQWNAICDRCGFKFKSGELKKDWQGLMVCDRDFELRNPQDFLRIQPERIVPDWVRPRPPDVFETTCTLWGLSAYADLSTADCAKADNAEFSYEFLANLKNGK